MSRGNLRDEQKDEFKNEIRHYFPFCRTIFFKKEKSRSYRSSSLQVQCVNVTIHSLPLPDNQIKTSLTDGEKKSGHLFLCCDSPLLNHPIIITITERENGPPVYQKKENKRKKDFGGR